MIGNDIIDLNIPISKNWNTSRYLNKLYSSAEQTAIFNAVYPRIRLQLFWSLKEAAYKAHQRRFNLPRTYNPFDFHCELLSEASEEKETFKGIIRIGDQTYFSISKITATSIHSTATSEKNQNTSLKVFEGESNLKSILFTEYSLLLKEPKTNLKIQKNINGVPFLYLKNTRLRQAFSISHHGKYTAFAIALMNC